jgi:carbon monoxide dehydrogenase subunit G
MKLEQSFEVKAPLEAVWAALIDVERVAPCLPGADITEKGEDGTYRGNFKVKLGPTTAEYRGELRFEDIDEAARKATMRANGSDKRGQGTAKALIVNTLHDEGETTRVDVETDFTITGKLARFGRGGMIQDISNRMLRDFASCLQQSIESSPAPVAEAAPAPEEAPSAEPSSTPGPPPPAAQPAPRPAPQPAAPVKGFSLFLSVLWERIKRLFSRGRT